MHCRLLKKIWEWIKNIIVNDYDRCYNEEERKGYAAMECCGGYVGGTAATNYLSEKCVGCPHWVLIDDINEKEKK